MWIRARNLFEEIRDYIANGNEVNDNIRASKLVATLVKNRRHLVEILKNTSKSPAHRAEIDKLGNTVTLESGQTIKIDEGLRTESLIISDVFKCDEFEALELILTGEVQMQHFMYLTRGLCAVICYYDAHRFLSASVKALLELNCNPEVAKTPELSSFLSEFSTDPALAKHLIDVLHNVSAESELQILHQPNINGLGGPKHQQILIEIIEETIANCSDSLFNVCSCWHSESPPQFIKDLLTPLQSLAPTSEFQETQLYMWTAVLVLLYPQNIRNMPCGRQVLSSIYQEVQSMNWLDACVCASLQLACVVTYHWLNVHQAAREVLGGFKVNSDELLEKAINGMAFPFIRKCIITTSKFRKSIVAFEMIDALLKTFIAHFPNKLMVLLRVCEEELQCVEDCLSKGQLYRPRLHYENFLRCIADLYDTDQDYVVPFAAQFSSINTEELVKFLKMGKQLYSPVLHVAYLDLAKKLCRCQKTANFLFHLLSCSSSLNLDSDSLCWDHFWRALHEYLRLYKTKGTSTPAAHPFGSDTVQHISQTELAGLIAWIQLAETVALQDSEAQRNFVDHNTWICIDTAVGLLASGVPLLLKGALYRFLAALAYDDKGAWKVWMSLNAHAVLSSNEEGKLSGIQQELVERECAAKSFVSSLGFLHLMKPLFSHMANSIDCVHLAPYMQFVIKSVICQFANRSYQNILEMWEICSTACGCLFEFLKYYTVTASSVANSHLQVVVLTQILNDSPAFRSLMLVLLEGAERLADYSQRCREREAAVLSALRLLDICVARHATLVSAIRASDSSFIVSSLDSLLLSSVPGRHQTSCITLISSYISQAELLPRHAYRAASILRELSCTRPSLQLRLVQVLSPISADLINGAAKILSPKTSFIAISALDPIIFSRVETLSVERVRGETARLLIEMCTTAVETDPCIPNIAYLLCGFDLADLAETRIENPGVNGTPKTCLHSVIETVKDLIEDEDALYSSHSGFFEPMLRFLLRLVSTEASCSQTVLRFLRSNHDLIYLLAASPFFTSSKTRNPIAEEDVVYLNLRRMLQGLVLNLSAIELSSLLKINHYSQPERFYRLMFNDGEQDDSTQPQNGNLNATASPAILLSASPKVVSSTSGPQLLWKLLDLTKLDTETLEAPKLEILDSKKLQKIIGFCIQPTTSNVEQCDVEHLVWLLRRETLAIDADLQNDYFIQFSKEEEKVLTYCVAYNRLRSAEASARELLSGWLSFVNVMAVFAPVPFLAADIQIQLLTDAIYLLTGYGSGMDMDPALSSAISQCLFRLVNSVCEMLKTLGKKITALREALAPILSLLIQYIIQPGKRSLQSKLDLYGCMLHTLNSAIGKGNTFEQTSVDAVMEREDFLLGLAALEVGQKDSIKSTIREFGVELLNRLTNDICDSPHNLKVVAMSCLTQVLREDSLGSQTLTSTFVRNGNLRHILDSVMSVDLDPNNEAVSLRILLQFRTALTLFIRLALTDCGWCGLSEHHALEILASLPLWKNPPKEIFLNVTPDSKLRSLARLYMNTVDLVIRLCLSLCSNRNWKRCSEQILRLVLCNEEMLNQLGRIDRKNKTVQYSAILVSHIYLLDESMRDAICNSSCLDGLRSLVIESSEELEPGA